MLLTIIIDNGTFFTVTNHQAEVVCQTLAHVGRTHCAALLLTAAGCLVTANGWAGEDAGAPHPALEAMPFVMRGTVHDRARAPIKGARVQAFDASGA